MRVRVGVDYWRTEGVGSTCELRALSVKILAVILQATGRG